MDVPVGTFCGLLLNAVNDPMELVQKWTRDAQGEAGALVYARDTEMTAIEAEAEVEEVVVHLEETAVEDDAAAVVNPIGTEGSKAVGQTQYCPVMFLGSPKVWWAMVDGGA